MESNRKETDTRYSLSATYDKLRAMLRSYENACIVRHDDSTMYSIYTPPVDSRGKQDLFVRVHLRDFCVSYQLKPLDAYPELFVRISPRLRKRMHGTSCFMFGSPTAEDLEELQELTEECFRRLRSEGLLDRAA